MPLVELKDGSTVIFLAPGAQGDLNEAASRQTLSRVWCQRCV